MKWQVQIPKSCPADGPPCGNARLGTFDADQCPRCWLVVPGQDVKPQPPPKVKSSPVSCPYRGEPTGEMVECPTCSGTVKLKVFNCSKNGRCTLGRKVDGIALCCGYSPRKDSP